jgi:hypothetical protein
MYRKLIYTYTKGETDRKGKMLEGKQRARERIYI